MEMGLVCCAAKLRFWPEGVRLLGRELEALSRSTEPRTGHTPLASVAVVGCTRGMGGGAGKGGGLSTQTITWLCLNSLDLEVKFS